MAQPGVRARRREARRLGKLSADDIARELGAAPRFVRQLIRADADGMADPGELDRLRAEYPCRAGGCPHVALGPTGYCRDHKAMSQRGVTRTPEQRENISAGMCGRPRPANAEALRKRWEDPEYREPLLRTRLEKIDQAHQALEQEKAERGAMTVDDVVDVLKDRKLWRCHGSVTEHIRQGRLEAERVPAPGLGGRGVYFVSPTAFEAYTEWVAMTYPGGWLPDFNDPRVRAEWYTLAFKARGRGCAAEYGRLFGGRPAGTFFLTPEEDKRVYELADDGKSQQDIATKLTLERTKAGHRKPTVTRDHVRGALGRR